MSRAVALPRSDRAIAAWITTLLLAGIVPQYLVGSLAVSIRDTFPFTTGDLGAAIAMSFGVAALAASVSGRVIGWLGLGWAVAAGGALAGLSSLGIATMGGSAGDIVLFMGVHGVGTGIGAPSLSALLAQEMPNARQATAFGVFTATPQMAAIVGGLALPLVAGPFGWRAAFLIPAAATPLCLWFLWRSGRLGRRASGEDADAPKLRRHPLAIRLIALSTGFVSAAGMGMRAFLVVFLVSIGFSEGLGGLLLSITGLLALASRIGLGLHADRRGGDPIVQAALLMGLCVVGFLLMALGGAALAVVGAILAGGIGWGWQAPLTLAVIAKSPEAPGPALGLQLTGFYVGAVVGPLLVGWLAGGPGYSVAWVLSAALAVIAIVVAMGARR